MAWIESHQELARHPKTKRLARELGVSLRDAIGCLHLLWWWALDYAEDGDLSRFTASDVADALLWDDDPDQLMAGLHDAGFIDDDDRIHDWRRIAGHKRSVQLALSRKYGPRQRNPVRRAWDALARKLRPIVFERDGYRCVQCGRDESLEVDHVIPIARGGSNDLFNLQTLCRPCNNIKAAN